MKTILITGGAGFIGSNFIHRMLKNKNPCKLINLDALTYAGNLNNLDEIQENENYYFYHGSISDNALVESVFEKHSIQWVVNFAAESHVDRSIHDPGIFVETNVMGTQVLLEAAKKAWTTGRDPEGYPTYKKNVKFLQVSTDEVYGALGSKGLFSEKTPLNPTSPYAASKAAADLLVMAYYKTYKLPVNITRCSNNFGAYQFPEKLIPLMISNALKDKPLPVYGDGMQVRDWLHVDDHCDGIGTVLENGLPGEIYNIGGNNEKANIEIVEKILEIVGKPKTLITHVEDRLGHDRRYAVDNTKITTELDWKPQYSFAGGLQFTVDWYLRNQRWLQEIETGAYRKRMTVKSN